MMLLIQPATAAKAAGLSFTCEQLQVGLREGLLDLQCVLLAVQLVSITSAPLLRLLQLRLKLLTAQLAALVCQTPGGSSPKGPGLLGLLLQAALKLLCSQHLQQVWG